MHLRDFARSGHRPTLGVAFLYFDASLLNENLVVGARGPTCEAALRACGVRAHVVPENPKMGPLVIALMRMLERRQSSGSSSNSPSLVTH